MRTYNLTPGQELLFACRYRLGTASNFVVYMSEADKSCKAALWGALPGAGPAQPDGWNGGRLRPLDATLETGNTAEVEEDTAASALLLKHEFLDGGADDVTLGEVLLEPTPTARALTVGGFQLEGYAMTLSAFAWPVTLRHLRFQLTDIRGQVVRMRGSYSAASGPRALLLRAHKVRCSLRSVGRAAQTTRLSARRPLGLLQGRPRQSGFLRLGASGPSSHPWPRRKCGSLPRELLSKAYAAEAAGLHEVVQVEVARDERGGLAVRLVPLQVAHHLLEARSLVETVGPKRLHLFKGYCATSSTVCSIP